MSDLKLGVIGVGHLGSYHAEKYQSMPDIELVGLYDINESQAEKIAQKHDVKSFSDMAELISKVDAVSIAVPTRSHFEVAGQSLKNGVHVLLEKPITSDLDEARKLIDLASQQDLILSVGQIERFNPAFKVGEPLISDPAHITASRFCPFPDRNFDVDVVLDLMIHDLDLILSLTREMPTTVTAIGYSVLTDTNDIVSAFLTFPSGLTAEVRASRTAKKHEREFQVFGSDAYLILDFGSHTVSRHLITTDAVSRFETLDVPKYDALYVELKSFVDAVRGLESSTVTGEDGLNALKLGLRIIDQIEKN